ncbi:MAG: SCO family protein [Candidatus Binatia bacterium]
MIGAVAFACAGLLSASAAMADGGAGSAKGRPPLSHSDFTYTYGIGAFEPAYAPPAPGTYELPPIDTVADHAVVDAAGKKTTLSEIIDGRLAVISFIYASCAEATGCPMSTAVLHRLDRELAANPEFARDVALVSVSFDPVRDTPARLAEMQKQRAPGSSWQFVTASDEASLSPLLEDFGQSISKLYYPDGAWTGVYRHVLKVFLLDRNRRVRNVYSVGFLHPDLVRNDLETLRRQNTN